MVNKMDLPSRLTITLLMSILCSLMLVDVYLNNQLSLRGEEWASLNQQISVLQLQNMVLEDQIAYHESLQLTDKLTPFLGLSQRAEPIWYTKLR